MNQATLNLCADMKHERAYRTLEEARQALFELHGKAPWASSLAWCDTGKLIGDIERGRVPFLTVLSALDSARRSGCFPASQMHAMENALMNLKLRNNQTTTTK